MWPFLTKPCAVCVEKELRLSALEQQILLLKGQLAHSREREEKAVDALLDKQGVKSVTPQPRMTAKDSENALKDVMGIFIDDEDKGDGNILEADRLNVQESPFR